MATLKLCVSEWDAEALYNIVSVTPGKQASKLTLLIRDAIDDARIQSLKDKVNHERMMRVARASGMGMDDNGCDTANHCAEGSDAPPDAHRTRVA